MEQETEDQLVGMGLWDRRSVQETKRMFLTSCDGKKSHRDQLERERGSFSSIMREVPLMVVGQVISPMEEFLNNCDGTSPREGCGTGGQS